MTIAPENKDLELTQKPPLLVAHRGYSGRYPENTLLSYETAYAHGGRYMELDLQMTSDKVPVLHHDVSLVRMAGVDLDVREISSSKFTALKASYAERFSDEFSENTFTTFVDFCQWLVNFPDVTVFVEMKQESIQHFGIELFMDEVYKCMTSYGVENQCVIISFNYEVLEYSRKISSMRIGWVLPKWNKSNKLIAAELDPEFLFSDKKILPLDDGDIWSGDWQWAVYNLDDVGSAIKMANRGIAYLETNQIGTLLADKQLGNQE